jgi:hypothetical protein
MEEKIKIELSQDEVDTFMYMQEHYTNIKKLKELGVFDFQAKTVHLHINPCGLIKEVDVVVRCVSKNK